MKQELLESFIRVRVTKADRDFIDQHILITGTSISDLFRDMLRELKYSSMNTEK